MGREGKGKGKAEREHLEWVEREVERGKLKERIWKGVERRV